ncbi:uncharacterized protein V1518DRAFT_413230 [Limtongia smithiae]|uniref:uncharacterized protein n=1 Tax=Limtongia smithiae TaxID=1125753 RepID=UPI0034CE35DC
MHHEAPSPLMLSPALSPSPSPLLRPVSVSAKRQQMSVALPSPPRLPASTRVPYTTQHSYQQHNEATPYLIPAGSPLGPVTPMQLAEEDFQFPSPSQATSTGQPFGWRSAARDEEMQQQMLLQQQQQQQQILLQQQQLLLQQQQQMPYRTTSTAPSSLLTSALSAAATRRQRRPPVTPHYGGSSSSSASSTLSTPSGGVGRCMPSSSSSVATSVPTSPLSPVMSETVDDEMEDLSIGSM